MYYICKAWKASSDRQVIDYELVFYRETPYSVRTYNEYKSEKENEDRDRIRLHFK